MSQHDFDITTSDANTGSTMRAQINSALQALASCSSGATSPGTTYANQFWFDSTSGTLKQRNSSNSGWNILPVFDASGNVGIGTSSPSQKLHVGGHISASFSVGEIQNTFTTLTWGNECAWLSGNAYYSPVNTQPITEGNAKFIRNQNGNSNAAGLLRFLGNGGTWNFYSAPTTTADSVIDFGNPKLSIDSNGNLLVGDTTGTCHRIQKSQATAGGDVLAVNNSSSTTGTGCLNVGKNTNNDATGYFIRCGDAGAWRMYVLGNGNLQNLNNAYGALSDRKLKTNITDSRSYLDDLCSVKIRKYNFIAEPDTPQQLGVIAQELEEIFPSVVDETPDIAQRPSGKYEQTEITPAVIDEETGEVITPAVMGDDLSRPIMETYLTGETTKSVKYSVFVPMLITAVQSLKSQNDALELRLALLESKLAG